MASDPIALKSINDKDKLKLREGFIALKYLPRFFNEVKKDSGLYFWINIFCRLLSSAFPVILLWIGKNIIDEVVLQTKNADKNYDQIWFYLVVEISLFIIQDIINKVIAVTDGWMGDKYANASSVRLIQKTKDVNLSDLEDPEFYNKLNLARMQTQGRIYMMSNVLFQIQDFITMLSLIIGLVVFEPWLIVMLFLSLIPSFINELKFSSSSYSLAKSWTSERRELDYLRYIGANDKTAKEIKLYNLADFIAQRFTILSDKYYEANKKLIKRQAVFTSLFNIIGTLCYYFAFVLIILKTVKGLLSIGEMTFLSTSFNRLKNNVSSIFARVSFITQNALYLQDYYEFIDMEVDDNKSFELKPIPSDIQTGFEFVNVKFSYPGAEDAVLKGINLKIGVGEKLALVGENGSGKTTLIKLLLRFYDPTEGSILLDGVDIRHFKKEEYQQLFGVIFQDFVQYEFTIGENIAVGNVESSHNKEKIEKAAENSLAMEVVNQMPEKFDQQLGKRFKAGKELSGGQWQKIALARAYMKDAQVMVLDEPTSALDARSEYEAFQRFIALTSGKTSVIISHRFSTVRMADHIMVLKDGVVLEYGTHGELILMKGLYAELFDLQAAGFKN